MTTSATTFDAAKAEKACAILDKLWAERDKANPFALVGLAAEKAKLLKDPQPMAFNVQLYNTMAMVKALIRSGVPIYDAFRLLPMGMVSVKLHADALGLDIPTGEDGHYSFA
ncbi:MAG: hypothetical protein WAX89_06950 [Alphaproteobacteria bacterium]